MTVSIWLRQVTRSESSSRGWGELEGSGYGNFGLRKRRAWDEVDSMSEETSHSEGLFISRMACTVSLLPFTSHPAPKSHCNSIPVLSPLLLRIQPHSLTTRSQWPRGPDYGNMQAESLPSLTCTLPPISTGISTKILAEAHPNSFGTHITHPQRIREQWRQTINIIAETENWLYPRQKMSLSEARILTTHSDDCMHSWTQLQGQQLTQIYFRVYVTHSECQTNTV